MVDVVALRNTVLAKNVSSKADQRQRRYLEFCGNGVETIFQAGTFLFGGTREYIDMKLFTCAVVKVDIELDDRRLSAELGLFSSIVSAGSEKMFSFTCMS